MLDPAREMLTIASDKGEHVALRGQNSMGARLAAVLLNRRIFYVACGADRGKKAVRVSGYAGGDRIR